MREGAVATIVPTQLRERDEHLARVGDALSEEAVSDLRRLMRRRAWIGIGEPCQRIGCCSIQTSLDGLINKLFVTLDLSHGRSVYYSDQSPLSLLAKHNSLFPTNLVGDSLECAPVSLTSYERRDGWSRR